MANDLLHALIRANLAGTVIALILLAARAPQRRWIGPSAVYALWVAVPVAGLASLLPSRTIITVLRADALGVPAAGAVRAAIRTSGMDWPSLLAAGWIIGVIVAAAVIVWRHYRFLATVGLLEERDGVLKAVTSNAGPAVIGLITPRILVPGDFETRFSPREQGVILAHEGIHLARGDSRINAVVLAVQCLSWFNPVAHIAARALRLDQELACDAGVMARFPKARRSYAEAMLKTQTESITLPVGCYWQAKGASALSHRLALLKVEPLSRSQVMAGLLVALLMTSGAGVVAWAAQPARQRILVEPQAQAPMTAVASAAGRATTLRPHRVTGRRLEAVNTPSPIEPAVDAAPQQPAGQPEPWSRAAPWNSMPMPADPDPAYPVASGGNVAFADGHMAAQSANGGNQVQTVSTYRSGLYQMTSDFTQVGDKIQVSTQLYKSGAMIGAGTATTTALAETAYVSLSNGQVAQVAPGKTAYITTPIRTGPVNLGPAPS
jgi:prepilin-type processing-associated H-X9-DG protein